MANPSPTSSFSWKSVKRMNGHPITSAEGSDAREMREDKGRISVPSSLWIPCPRLSVSVGGCGAVDRCPSPYCQWLRDNPSECGDGFNNRRSEGASAEELFRVFH